MKTKTTRIEIEVIDENKTIYEVNKDIERKGGHIKSRYGKHWREKIE